MTDSEREALRKKRGVPLITDKQKQILENYFADSPYAQIDKLAQTPASPMVDSLFGQGKFRGSDRKAEGLAEGMDSYLGAPVRVAVDRLQGGNVKAALLDAMAQAGRDPKEAPTGVDIASKVTDNPYLGAGLATAVDLGAQVPMPFSPGVVGKVKNIAPEAEAILSKIKTPEQAVALEGAEREQYLKALDEVYGDRAKRAKDMGFGDETWYHGGPDGIESFRPSGETHELGSGVYTGTEDVAKGFGKKIYELLQRGKNLDVDEVGPAQDTARRLLKKGGMSQTEIETLFDNPMLNPNNPDMTRVDLHKQAKEILSKHGYTSFGSYFDGGGQRAVFDPSDLRSVNAAFDPRFKDSDLLLAGKAGVNPSDLPSPLISAIRQKREEKNRNK